MQIISHIAFQLIYIYIMNHTKNCKEHLYIYLSYDSESIVLKVVDAIVCMAIICANTYLINLLWNKRRISINILFIILSCFDILTGIVAIPMYMLITTIHINYCSFYRVVDATFVFSVGYPWFMITLIAIDRHLIITKHPRLHEKYMSMKRICDYVIMIVGLTVTLSLWYTFIKTREQWLELNVAMITAFFILFILLLVTFSLYIHLVIFVYKKDKIMQGNRHGKKQDSYSIRTAKTVFLVLLCLVGCNLSFATVMLYISVNKNLDTTVKHSMIGWCFLLSYSNSFFNAVIIISRSRNSKQSKRVVSQLPKRIETKI